MAMAIAAIVAVAIVAGLVIYSERSKPKAQVTAISATLDPYAASLPLSNLAMSESSNLVGGKVTYLDGQIANTGNRTVTGISVQVLFRNYAHEVAWSDPQPLKLIRMRDPYIDVEPVAEAPLKPGDHHDFRLIFDSVPESWDGAYPEVRIVRVDSQ
jgi:hypothetical protein